jgi:mRNA interferase MazF
VQVVPLTSQVAKAYPSEAMVTSAGKRGKAMADQLTMLSKLRLVSRGGELDSAEMRRVQQVIRIQLGLN